MKETFQYIYGIHTCNAQLKLDPNSINKVFFKKPPHNNHLKTIFDKCESMGLDMMELERDRLTSLCLSSKHQGIVIELSSKLSSGFNLDLYLQTEKNPFIVIFDSLQDPRNLGSCIRTSNAAGASLIIKKKSNSCEISPLVHKTASGGLQGLSLLETNNVLSVIKKLKNNNIRIIGTSDAGSKSIYDLQQIMSGVAVIIGAEGEGVSRSLLESCDDICSIPIYGSVECLNVAVATGITLYQIKKLIKKTK
jgi:23S rRNA (guanosine2251-2'-O)-methyltransferase